MEKNKLYDLVIIGAGPGGYIAAERAEIDAAAAEAAAEAEAAALEAAAEN